jgi:LmbE family N-acetylglucosaminyl deacetylase
MAQGITYQRRRPGGTLSSPDVGEVFGGWNAGRECWMFVAAHDDDIIAGGGLTFLAALAEGIQTHAVITTDGRMGYCRPEQRQTVSQVRHAEACRSFGVLGLPLDRLHFLQFPDCNLNPYRGRHLTDSPDAAVLHGAIGLQNSFPYILRKVRPTRVFLPTIADLHPDHRIVNEEFLISLFHAQGNIWPELGPPLEAVPLVYEYATYCDFPEAPQIRIQGTPALLEQKLAGIRAYASQEQIELLVDVQRAAGPVEYIREVAFHFYSPQAYDKLFA